MERMRWMLLAVLATVGCYRETQPRLASHAAAQSQPTLASELAPFDPPPPPPPAPVYVGPSPEQVAQENADRRHRLMMVGLALQGIGQGLKDSAAVQSRPIAQPQFAPPPPTYRCRPRPAFPEQMDCYPQ